MGLKLTRAVKVRAETLLAFDNTLNYDIYIKVSDRLILTAANKQNAELGANAQKLKLYMMRGATEFYLGREDYEAFTACIQKTLTSKSVKDEACKFKRMQQLNEGGKLFKSMIKSRRLRDNAEKLSKSVVTATVELSESCPDFVTLYVDCFSREGFAETFSFLVQHISFGMITTFDWSSLTVKSHIVLGTLLSDLTLSDDDLLNVSLVEDPEDLPDKLYYHPTYAAGAIEKYASYIKPEVIEIVKQHHEVPGDKGYPTGTSYEDINQLSAICIVANDFVERLFNHSATPSTVTKVLKDMESIYKWGRFKKAFYGLKICIAGELRRIA